MLNQFSRTELLIGKEAMNILNNARVAVFGIGGVGGYVVEALVRSGIQHIDIIDNDTVSLTNLNRQIIATHSTIGRYKVDVMKERILDINPDAEVNAYRCFYLPETKDQFDFSKYDYVVDAIDTVTAKLQLIMQAKAAGTKIICAMGAGNKMDPTQFEITDISKTTVCPLARVMRQECKKRGITDVKVLYSKEKALHPVMDTTEIRNEKKAEAAEKGEEISLPRRDTPGSNAFVPSAAGLIMAGEIIRDLTKDAVKKLQKE